MEKPETKKEKEFTGIAIGEVKRRFSDCCNAFIQNNRCPKCGRYLEESEGRREIIIKGLDGKTKHGEPDILLSTINTDKPKEDKKPPLFRDMEQRGIKILSWSDSSTSSS